jgi:signal transduction histidine kinase
LTGRASRANRRGNVTRRSSWIWIVLFILGVLLLGTLATSWNVVILREHRHWVELTRDTRQNLPVLGILLGSLGFLGAMAGLILFFLKVQREIRLNEMQSEFLASVSHELKTPLATLELACTALRNPRDLPESARAKLWHSVDAELSRLRGDVESLLAAAQLQLTPHTPSRQRFVLQDWLHEAEARWRKILGEGARLQLAVSKGISAVDLDPRLLATITDNLIDNARKFCLEEPRVQVSLEPLARSHPLASPRFRLTFRDEGRGFTPETSAKLFRRFYRERKRSAAPIPGTGLGLHLALSAANALGLELKAFSEGPGKGATFVLEGALAE